MKLQITKEALVKALSSIQSVVEKKGPPILSHVLLEAEDGRLRLFATDFDLTIQVLVDALVMEKGKTTAPARSFLEIAREFPGKEIELVFDHLGRLNISTERAHFQLPSLDVSDFPVDQLEEEVDYSPCNGEILKKSLTKTFYAIPVTASSIGISGLCLSKDSEDIKFISCDAFRLAKYQVPIEKVGLGFISEEIVIPRKGVQEVIRVIDDAEGNEVFLGIHENVFYAKSDRMIVSMRLLDATFPAFDAVIPKERPYVAEIPVATFQQVLKRMSVFTNQVLRHVNLFLHEGVLEISAGNPEIGIGREEIPINYGGKASFSASFNIKYLGDAVNVVSGDIFRFEWSPDMEGGFVTDPEDPGYMAFFMPMVA
ncbi:MAG: DNA polymerase III subunit beta [Syntrophobacterales bacterium]|nr:DNA polymerase III subunit beta [Syntrophobacterales bacterium]